MPEITVNRKDYTGIKLAGAVVQPAEGYRPMRFYIGTNKRESGKPYSVLTRFWNIDLDSMSEFMEFSEHATYEEAFQMVSKAVILVMTGNAPISPAKPKFIDVSDEMLSALDPQMREVWKTVDKVYNDLLVSGDPEKCLLAASLMRGFAAYFAGDLLDYTEHNQAYDRSLEQKIRSRVQPADPIRTAMPWN